MLTVNIHEAKTNLSKLIEEALANNTEFIIANRGTPAVLVQPYKEKKAEFIFDLMKGEFEIPEDFDAPCKEIEDLFYGEIA
jgi:prevent-host-death family protein